jgi:hypothetical protein
MLAQVKNVISNTDASQIEILAYELAKAIEDAISEKVSDAADKAFQNFHERTTALETKMKDVLAVTASIA